MKIVIETFNKNISVSRDFSDCENREEISNYIVELELIKNKLLKMYDEFDNIELGEVNED